MHERKEKFDFNRQLFTPEERAVKEKELNGMTIDEIRERIKVLRPWLDRPDDGSDEWRLSIAEYALAANIALSKAFEAEDKKEGDDI